MFPLPTMPPFATGTVVGQAGDSYGVNVLLDGRLGGSGPTLPVDVGTHGPRDGLRVEQPPLPTKGTRGLIAFPHGDHRNGIWICSISGPLHDALTSRNGLENVSYQSHFSGFWRMLDEGGNLTIAWPDGSSLTVGVAPQPTRHIVTAGQQRQTVPFTQGQRVASTPSPMPLVYNHASGLTLTISAGGAVTLAMPGGPGGQPFTVTGDIHATGAVIAGFGGGDQVGLQTHEHAQGDDSHGDTEQNTTAPIAGT